MPEFDFTTLFFAVVAVAVAVRLYFTLGKHAPTDAERGSNVVNLRRAGPTEAAPASVRAAPADDEARWRGCAPPGSPAERGLAAIAAADRTFDARAFLSGAAAAYPMIVKAFAAGDSAALRPLLAPEVFAQFAAQIAARKGAGRVASVAFVGAPTAEIASASLEGGHAHVGVRFSARLISAVRDSAGAVVEGSAETPEAHSDLWTFSRDPASKDPNWALVATEAVDPA